jgi:hypothetical protein
MSPRSRDRPKFILSRLGVVAPIIMGEVVTCRTSCLFSIGVVHTLRHQMRDRGHAADDVLRRGGNG